MLEWENITKETTNRLKVPLGWLVRSYRSKWHTWCGGASDAIGVAMVFVFDLLHLWKIKEEKKGKIMSDNITLYKQVLLPLSSNKKERNVLSLDASAQLTLHTKELLFYSSWEKMIKHINEKGSQAQKDSDIKIINNLMAIEKKYKVDLYKLLIAWTSQEEGE